MSFLNINYGYRFWVELKKKKKEKSQMIFIDAMK